MAKEKIILGAIIVLAIGGGAVSYYRTVSTPDQAGGEVQDAAATTTATSPEPQPGPIKEGPRQGYIEGTLGTIGTSTVEVIDVLGSKKSYEVRPEVVISRTDTIQLADLAPKEAVIVSLNPNSGDVFAVTAFTDAKQAPVQPSDDQNAFFSGTVVSVTGNSLAIRQDDGSSKTFTVSAGVVTRVEILRLSDLKPGDAVRMAWYAVDDEGPQAVGIYLISPR